LVLNGGNLGSPVNGVGDEFVINDHFNTLLGLFFLSEGKVGGDEFFGGFSGLAGGTAGDALAAKASGTDGGVASAIFGKSGCGEADH